MASTRNTKAHVFHTRDHDIENSTSYVNDAFEVTHCPALSFSSQQSQAAISSTTSSHSEIEKSLTTQKNYKMNVDPTMPTIDTNCLVPFHQRIVQPWIHLPLTEPLHIQVQTVVPQGEMSKLYALQVLHLLDIENGKCMIYRNNSNPQNNNAGNVGDIVSEGGSFVMMDSTKSPVPRKSDQHMVYSSEVKIKISQSRSEVGIMGHAWRLALKQIILSTLDEVNILRLSRLLQFNLPFLTAYEAYIASQLLQALDHGHIHEISTALSIVFQNRNVSRLVVRTILRRWDFLWHWNTAVRWNRVFDAIGQLPVVGITRFPATENFPGTRNHALASIFRIVLGPGNWIARFVTRGRQELITDNIHAPAQNLAAESNGFESANRQQYGTYFGRIKTNEFRFAHRLPVDESLIRTFITVPTSTMTNNGVVHVLRQLAKHWTNLLNEPYGNFAHQRMEQLDPFETLRFHVPEVLVVLSSLRGRNRWDSEVLGPVINRLQHLKPGPSVQEARALVTILREKIVFPVCGGIMTVVAPFHKWLVAIDRACTGIEKEAKEIYRKLQDVELGIRLGHDIMAQVKWKLPSTEKLRQEILNFLLGKHVGVIDEQQIRNALESTTPRDKRTLIELIQKNLSHTQPSKLLLGRVRTLLVRELRRKILNDTIRHMSKGPLVQVHDLIVNEWYFLQGAGFEGVHVFLGEIDGFSRFLSIVSATEFSILLSDDRSPRVWYYIPVAEAISRAQKMFMILEVDNGKKYKYNAFMEFDFLRDALRRLIVVSQMNCELLDIARLNILREIQRLCPNQISLDKLVPGRTYYAYDSSTLRCTPFNWKGKEAMDQHLWELVSRSRVFQDRPQSVLVVGGGPAGLIATIHCLENCLLSGGVMKLFEARDAFSKGGSTFERAQIVRLDARWIAVLRYYLGTGFEDVFISLEGETDAQLGNMLPPQGFVELAIKTLESMLHDEVSRLWSRGLIRLFTEAKARFDPKTNALTKFGEHLKVDDLVFRNVDEEGKDSFGFYSWKVVDLTYLPSLEVRSLKVGQEYGIFLSTNQAVLPFVFERVNLESKMYVFRSLTEGIDSFQVNVNNLPNIYPSGTEPNSSPSVVRSVIFESIKANKNGFHLRQEILMHNIKKTRFNLDVGHTHVVEAIGKPHGSSVHFLMTTTEPHATLCLQGLKVSLLMHNFGEKRFRLGLWDDIRTIDDQNTRIISDFTKMIRIKPIVEEMFVTVKTNKRWRSHFLNVTNDAMYSGAVDKSSILTTIVGACGWLAANSSSFQRKTLQTRFFETGDNFYLGMELAREYGRWKKILVGQIISRLNLDDSRKRHLSNALQHSIDSLWYESCLETFRTADVYNPAGKRHVPRLYLIDSDIETQVGRLALGESFRNSTDSSMLYEILVKGRKVLARDVGGHISWLPKSTLVKMQGNFTRSPDGNEPSKVALCSFNVGHFVNHRSMRTLDAENEYVFAFIGDEQATPHFMRYSGLTGACINATSFNNFLKAGMQRTPFKNRYSEYVAETNWSNSEVVTRGVGTSYGDVGFLRPGFSYHAFVDYLFSKVVEGRECDADMNNFLSADWKTKFAASLIPRGLEMDKDFIKKILFLLQNAIFEKIVREAKKDKRFHNFNVEQVLRTAKSSVPQREACSQGFWPVVMSAIHIGPSSDVLADSYVFIGIILNKICVELIEWAKKGYIFNERVSSELFNQPKPVDSMVDDFAIEAQGFANALTLSAAFAAGALAFQLVDAQAAKMSSAVLAILNIPIAFGTITNVSRYKIRNEEARIFVFESKWTRIKMQVFALLTPDMRSKVSRNENPFLTELESSVQQFRNLSRYYDYQENDEFNVAYASLKSNLLDTVHLKKFQQLLAVKFIPAHYHVNSYVQASLVGVYKTVRMIKELLIQSASSSIDPSLALDLFNKLQIFEPRLKSSLQTGPVRWGFVKKRQFKHWDITVVLRYFCSTLLWSSCGRNWWAPIEVQTQWLLQASKRLSIQSNVFTKETRDIETLYWATKESDIASMIIVSSSLTLLSSVVFTIGRILTLRNLVRFAFYSFAVSSLGAVLAVFHFVRKLKILIGLWIAVGEKAVSGLPDKKNEIRQVRFITMISILLTFTRLIAASAAAIALPFSVAQSGYSHSIETPRNLPFWIAAGAVVTSLAASLFFLIVEYVVRWNLTTFLGPFVCELFRDEVQHIYSTMSTQLNEIDTQQIQDREAWEYTAREFFHQYRFDTVFAADRFGMLLQYIQSGMQRPGAVE